MLTDQEIGALIDHALKARECAYAPYSKFRVGTAVVDENGRVFSGANVENASYGLSLCAERAAMASAVAAGAKRMTALVLVTDAEPPTTPCGACRQWLAELGDAQTEIVVANEEGKFRRYTLGPLLPDAFELKKP